MAKFKFRLVTLLKLREAARDERRSQLAEAYRVDDVLNERLEEIARQLSGLKDHCRKVIGPGTIDVDQLVEAQQFELALASQRTRLDRQRRTVAEEIERRRQTLVEANRDVRVLEKLREKQAGRHRQEEDRRETKVLDEVAGRQVAREDCR